MAVVASEVGGIPEIVRHDETGLLVPPRDVPALAAAVERAVDDPVLRSRMADRARPAVRDAFDVETNLCRLVEQFAHAQRTVARAYARDARVAARDTRTPIDVLFVMNALRVGGEETELLLLARHSDRERFRLHAVSLTPIDEPEVVARLRALGVSVDTRAHALAVDDAVTHLRTLTGDGVKLPTLTPKVLQKWANAFAPAGAKSLQPTAPLERWPADALHALLHGSDRVEPAFVGLLPLLQQILDREESDEEESADSTGEADMPPPSEPPPPA